MPAVRVNVSLPESTYSELKKEVPLRERSRFIATAIKRLIKERQKERLAVEYREAANEMEESYRDLEGTLSDGL
jgi:metal-responsive CopG/Arc/MetJ family transcriptional regulator